MSAAVYGRAPRVSTRCGGRPSGDAGAKAEAPPHGPATARKATSGVGSWDRGPGLGPVGGRPRWDCDGARWVGVRRVAEVLGRIPAGAARTPHKSRSTRFPRL